MSDTKTRNASRKAYLAPGFQTSESFERLALSCGGNAGDGCGPGDKVAKGVGCGAACSTS